MKTETPRRRRTNKITQEQKQPRNRLELNDRKEQAKIQNQLDHTQKRKVEREDKEPGKFVLPSL
jgi:hypothetical protein